MDNQHYSLKPVIGCITGIIFLQVTLSVASYFALRHLGVADKVSTFSAERIFSLCLLTADLVLYVYLRKKDFNRTAVMIHLTCLIICYLLLPLCSIVLPVVLGRNVQGDDYLDTLRLIGMINFYVFWSLLVVGHIVFVKAIVKALKSKTVMLPPNADDLLDEFA